MSIREKLQDTASYLRSTRKAILGRGGEIAENAGLKEIADAVYKIPADTSLVYQTDDSVAYHKIVPTNAEEYAQVEQVGGMTYKTENLIPFPFDYDVGYVKELSGVKFTILSDGGISVVGTPTSTGLFTFISEDVTNLTNVCQDGKQYTISGGKTGILVVAHKTPIDGATQSSGWLEAGSTGQATGVMPEGYRLYRVGIYIGSAAVGTAINTVIYPMLNEGSTALPYSPFFEGLRDTKVTEMKSNGVNLLDISQALNKNLVDNGDGTYTFTRTTDGWTGRFSADINTHIPAGVTVSIKATSLSSEVVSIGFYDADGNSAGSSVSTNGTLWLRTFNKDVKTMKMYLRTESPVGTYAKFSELQINYGSTAAPYKPYRAEAIDTLTISAELRAFLEQYGYGRGVEGYPNYIDFERKVFVQNTYRKVFDGTEAFTKVGTAEWTWYLDAIAKFYGASSTNILLCNLFNPKYSNTNGSVYIGGSVNDKGNRIIFYDDAYATVDAWKAHLAELYANGNPLIVEYALAKPIEVDISAYLKDGIVFLQVEGGGTITAVNEREQAAPSTIKYMTKVGN